MKQNCADRSSERSVVCALPLGPSPRDLVTGNCCSGHRVVRFSGFHLRICDEDVDERRTWKQGCCRLRISMVRRLRPEGRGSSHTELACTGSFGSSGARSVRRPSSSMAAARGLVIWLHGLGDSGPANESLASFFTAPELRNFKWRFPSAPFQPVSCNGSAVMPSWFDLLEIPIVPESPNVDAHVLKAVESVHEMIDKEVAAGVSANNIFLCGFSQGGALTLASSMLYPKALAGAAVLSGWVPLDEAAFAAKITPAGKQTPVIWLHGMDDQVVKFSAGQAGPPFLARADVKCDFQAIPGLGHGIDAEGLSTLQRWMKERLQ